MDFPTTFDEPIKMVASLDELKATIYHLLKNELGSLLQSYSMGSYFSPHATEVDQVPKMITQTIEEIPQTRVVSCVMTSQDTYRVVVNHLSDQIVWDLDLSSL